MAITYYSDAAFFDAWKRGIALAGPQWFGTGAESSLAAARSKHQLAPRYDDIVEALGWLSSGEAAFLVALYSFYNSHAAGKMFDQIGVRGLAHLSSRLDEPRCRVLADLLVSYAGW